MLAIEVQVDNQVAAPGCNENTQLAPSENRSLRVRMEGWRQCNDSAGEKPCPTKNKSNPLDSDRPSHGRRLHSNFDCFLIRVILKLFGRVKSGFLVN
jgi:hypothetical protein